MPDQPAIIIKKVIKGGGGAHGGAWKVAYADFVTAMMAFFLLLWLLNVTTDEQKHGIADYFAPTTASRSTSGSGGILGGQTLTSEGARVDDKSMPTVVVELTPPRVRKSGDSDKDGGKDTDIDEQEFQKELYEREKKALDQAKKQLEKAVDGSDELRKLKKHLLIDQTPEGLRIQIIDNEGRNLFSSGKSKVLEHTQKLLSMVAKVIATMPNQVSITGHTDAVPFRTKDGYGNWELSSDRANASRRILVKNGLPVSRISHVSGRAANEPLLADDPKNPKNRRISVVLLRQGSALPPQLRKKANQG